jgi:TP901 family phage tail tape measure protein
MAKKISDEIIKLSIVIDGNPAQKEILDLEKSNIKLKQSVTELNKKEKEKQAELNKVNKSYTAQKEKLDELSAANVELTAETTKEVEKLKDIEQQSGKTSSSYKTQERVIKSLEAESAKVQRGYDKAKTTVDKLNPVVDKLSTEYKELKAEITKTNKEIDSNESKLEKLTGALKVSQMTMAQLKARAQELSPLLRHLVPDSDQYKKVSGEMGEISERISELNSKAKGAKLSIGSIADSFNRYAALGASVVATFTGIVLSLQQMIDYNGKLADSQSDVMKTTRMTKQEVDELTKSFGTFQTRTSRMDLLGIAEQGGRVGVVKEEILDFVKVMDKASVALGDSFTGGPEEVAEKLGKIKFLFQETKNIGVEKAYMSIGSAINDLGADGVASERNIAEFTTRMGSLDDTLKPPLAAVLALGAGFEESGIEAEVSSRAYSIFMKQASTEIPKFAKVMKLSEQQVKDMINADPMEFMLKFAQGFKGVNMEATDTAQILSYLGINADGANKVIGALANNTGRFRDLIELSNQSFSDGTSLIEEYNIKNNNLAATLEKIKKKAMGWFSSEGLVKWLEAVVDWFARFIGATEDADGTITGFRGGLVVTAKIVAILIATIFSFNAAIKLASIWTRSAAISTALFNIAAKAQIMWVSLQRLGLTIYTTTMAAFGFTTDKASASLTRLNLVTKASPWGAVLALITAVVAAYIAFKNTADQTAAAVKRVNAATAVDIEMKKQLTKTTADLHSRTAPLIKILNDSNASLEIRKIAYQKLIEISPDFIGTVDKEFMATEKLGQAYDRLLAKLNKVALARAREKVRQERADAVALAETAEFEAKLKADQEAERNKQIAAQNKDKAKNAYTGGGASTLGGGYTTTYQGESNKDLEAYLDAKTKHVEARKAMQDFTDYQTKTIEELQARLKTVKEGSQEAKDIQDEINSILGMTEPGKTVTSKYSVPNESGEKAADKAHKRLLAKREKDKEALKKYQQELTDLEKQAFEARLANIDDNFEKQDVIESENHKRKIEELKKRLIDESQFTQLDATINDPNAKKIDKAVAMHQKEVWLEINKHVNSLIESEQGRHELAIDTIKLKAENKRLADQQEAFNAETTQRQTAHNNELAALGENATAREKLQEKFDKEELDKQMEHLQKMLAAQESILKDQNASIDFSLLTPEQQKDVQDQVDALKLKLSELMLAKQALAGKSGTDDLAAASKQVFGNADVLGFTADQWGATFKSLDTLSEKLAAAQMVVGALQNLWSTYNNYVAAGESASLANYEKTSDRRKKTLKKQLDNGYINQTQYKQGVELLDAELEKKKADIEYRQAKRQKVVAAMNILTSTAQAIMGIWAQVPKFDFGVSAGVLTGVVGALGALQLATVMKTPLPARGYEEGLYPEYVKREQDGKMFKSTFAGKTRSGLVTKPTHFLTGENGPEMIIDAKAYRQMSPETKQMLINELRGIKGFEGGYYNNDVKNPRYEVPAAAPATASSVISNDHALQIIVANTAIMEKIYNEGIVAVMTKEGRQIKKLQDELDRNKNSRDKAKV